MRLTLLKLMLAIGLAAAFCLTANARAQTFGGADVEGFIAVMTGAEALSERYEGEEDMLREQLDMDFTDFGSLLDEDGDFRIFRLSAKAMDEAGDLPAIRDYRKLVTESGFSDLSSFGAKADAIMMAYMATQMDTADFADMAAMPPEMMAMMPPSVKEQMAGVLKLGKALENVPGADIDTIRPYLGRIDAAMK